MLNSHFSFKNLANNKVFRNFTLLSSIQALNLIVPLVLTPYLLTTIGQENFGLVSLSQAILSYFIILNDYGFNLNATKEISQNKNDLKLVQKIFREALTTKFFLLLAGLGLIMLALFLLGTTSELKLFYLLSYSMVAGHTLFSVWLFQGMEDMKYISIVNVLSKIFTLFLTLILIKQESDYIYVNLFQGVGLIASGFISLFFVWEKYKITYKPVSMQAVFQQLMEGWHIFTSNLAANLYINSNIVILGLFASHMEVAIYKVAEQVINIVRQVLVAYYQAIYPYVCRLVHLTRKETFSFFKKYHFPFALLVLLVCLTIFSTANFISLYFLKDINSSLVVLLRLLSIVPFIVALNIPNNQLLLAYNLKREYSTIVITGSLLSILLNFILSRYLFSYGTALSVLITETFISLSFIVSVKKIPFHERKVT